MCMRHRGGGWGELRVRQWGLSSHLALPTKAFLFHLFPRNGVSCPIGSPKKQVNGKMLPVPKICNTLKTPSEALSVYNHLKWLVINQMTLYLLVSLTWSHTVVGFALQFYHKILCLIKHRVLETCGASARTPSWDNVPSRLSSLKQAAESWEGVWASVSVCAEIHRRVGGFRAPAIMLFARTAPLPFLTLLLRFFPSLPQSSPPRWNFDKGLVSV